MTNREGGCLCGAVRYSLAAKPGFTAICHCHHCQKQSGGAFSVNLFVYAGDFEISGATQVVRTVGDSGQASDRFFCPACGSPIMTLAPNLPGVVLVKAGTLDSSEGIVPQAEIYTDFAVPWHVPTEGAALSARAPDPAGAEL